MVIKKRLKSFIVFLSIIFLLPIVVIKLYDFLNNVSFGDYTNVISVLNIPKTIYNLNEDIHFSLSYNHQNNKTGLNICSDGNVSVIIKSNAPIESENYFPQEFQIKNITYDDISGIFKYKCSEELIIDKGLIIFEESKNYVFNFQFKFIKKNNDYFLSTNSMQMKVKEESNYYLLYIYIKEGFMSSGDVSTSLGKYVYMKIKDDRLHIFTPTMENRN